MNVPRYRIRTLIAVTLAFAGVFALWRYKPEWVIAIGGFIALCLPMVVLIRYRRAFRSIRNPGRMVLQVVAFAVCLVPIYVASEGPFVAYMLSATSSGELARALEWNLLLYGPFKPVGDQLPAFGPCMMVYEHAWCELFGVI